MTVTFDPTVLLDYYAVKTGVPLTSGGSTSQGRAASVPTAPWTGASTSQTASGGSSSSSATALTQASSLAESILVDGTQLIDPSAAKLSVSTTNAEANSDYQNLFALYQGLTSLQTLANGAATKGIGATSLTQLQNAFANGLSQVQGFLTSSPFQQFQVGDGTVTAKDQTSAGVPQETDTYTTGLTATSASTPLAQLQGDVQFSMTVQKFHAAPVTVNFDLSQMGSQPRTMANVVSYMNSQLAAAGVKTRFSDQLVSAGTTTGSGTTTPGTTGSGTTGLGTTGSGTTSPSNGTASLPQWALTIQGSALETVSFSAPATTPAVYVAQTSTEPVLAATTTSTTLATTTSTTTSTTSATTPTTVSQVLALDPTGTNAVSVGDKLWTDNLPSDATVQATATGSDGSVYVVADVSGAVNGQAIQGSQDVALLKYDSAGDLVYTRTLGSAASASGYSVAVSPDGTQVAVAGTATGTLDPTDTSAASSTTSQSFVTVYDTSGGNELWTQSQSASVDNQASGVAFGSDNAVYVTGSVQGSLQPGAISHVSEQGYLQTYSAKSTTDKTTGETSWTAAPTSTVQFGTTGINRATGLAVSGSTVYVSSVENGDAVVRAYDASTKTPTLAAMQDLGALDGGDVAGVALGADGSVYVAGSTHNAALNAGTVAQAYSGSGDAFVARLSSDLDPASGEQLTYLNNGGATTATAMTLAGGQVYITGQTATGASPSGASISMLGYAAAVDAGTGQVGWDQSFKGAEGNAAPVAIAADATGASSLDALGLPSGQIDYTPSNTLVANSSLRPGDEFYVKVGSGAATAVTIAGDDTYATLAQKIEQASGYRVTASTTTDANGNQELKVTPASTTTQTQVEIEAGPNGRDALGALGLKAGLITNTSTNAPAAASTTKNATNSLRAAYTVNVPTTLSLGTAAGVTAAQTQLATAIAEVKSIYSAMTTKPSAAVGTSSANDTALITFYQDQAANYSTALARLTGSSGTSSGSGLAALL